MKNDKFCFSKTLAYLVALVVVVVGAFYVMNYANSQKLGTTPKASEIKKDCDKYYDIYHFPYKYNTCLLLNFAKAEKLREWIFGGIQYKTIRLKTYSTNHKCGPLGLGRCVYFATKKDLELAERELTEFINNNSEASRVNREESKKEQEKLQLLYSSLLKMKDSQSEAARQNIMDNVISDIDNQLNEISIELEKNENRFKELDTKTIQKKLLVLVEIGDSLSYIKNKLESIRTIGAKTYLIKEKEENILSFISKYSSQYANLAREKDNYLKEFEFLNKQEAIRISDISLNKKELFIGIERVRCVNPILESNNDGKNKSNYKVYYIKRGVTYVNSDATVSLSSLGIKKIADYCSSEYRYCDGKKGYKYMYNTATREFTYFSSKDLVIEDINAYCIGDVSYLTHKCSSIVKDSSNTKKFYTKVYSGRQYSNVYYDKNLQDITKEINYNFGYWCKGVTFAQAENGSVINCVNLAEIMNPSSKGIPPGGYKLNTITRLIVEGDAYTDNKDNLYCVLTRDKNRSLINKKMKCQVLYSDYCLETIQK